MAMIDAVATGLEHSEPVVSIDLKREDAKEAKKYRPGQVLKITMIATVDSMNFRKPDDPDLTGYEGHMNLKLRDMEMGLSQRNAMAELLDDDE